MAIIKVTNTLFSSVKTIEKALKKCKPNDEIHVAPALYKETLQFTKSARVESSSMHDCVIQGAIVIPEHCHVTFKNITLQPTTHIHIEGSASFEHVVFEGSLTNALISISNGEVQLTNCTLKNAKDIGIAAFKGSRVNIQNCHFINNGKTHLLFDKSTGHVEQTQFQQSVHAIWLKNDATMTCQNNQLVKQNGTQVIVQQSKIRMAHCHIKDSKGNGLFASKHSDVELIDCIFQEHSLPQLWIQESNISCIRTFIENGAESGIMIRQHATCELTNCKISQHKIANIQLCLQSRLNIEQTTIEASDGIGIQVRDKSIANLLDTIITKNKLSQLFITESSIISINKCKIVEGFQVGIIAERNSQCSIVDSHISRHANSGMTILDSELIIMECSMDDNNGNGLLIMNDGTATVDNCTFTSNNMPHIGGKNRAMITVTNSHLTNGKSVYLVDECTILIEDCHIINSDGVQLELNDHSKGTFIRCHIQNGKTNALKLLRNSNAVISECHIANHLLPQIVANDSSFIIRNSEVIDGERNGFIIENHSEAHIEATYIARHKYPQIWVDLQSNVELNGVQLTEGVESDLYLQNESTLLALDSFIKNNTFTYNIQSINNSKIELQNTIIEHFNGDCFYTENNSEIISTSDNEKK